ncbi:Adenosine monophosphate-protein transferase VbhT [compost metagenome]
MQKQRGPLTYPHFLRVHYILFHEFYPWAGSDRYQLGVGRIVTKGQGVQFELSENCQQAVEWGLNDGNDKERMRRRPGGIMGAFAWGHPFLDGNGRTMLLVHAELCHRAGFSIDWIASKKHEYLDALTHELVHPQSQRLNSYFAGLMVESRPREDWIGHFKAIPGLAGGADEDEHISYSEDDMQAIARYEEIRKNREAKVLPKQGEKPDSGKIRRRRMGF